MYVQLALQGCAFSQYVLLTSRTVRGPAQYLTRFRRVFAPCWLSASLVSRRINIYTGSDERHLVRSIRWEELCQAVGGRDNVLHIVMVDRTHHLRVADADTLTVWITAINSAMDS